MASLDLNIFYSRGGFSINIKIKNSFQELTYFASDGFCGGDQRWFLFNSSTE